MESSKGNSSEPLCAALGWWSALSLAALFAAQFVVTGTCGRYVLSGIQLVVAIVALMIHRRDILPRCERRSAATRRAPLP